MGAGGLTAARACHLAVALIALAGIGIEYAAMAMAYPAAELGARTVNFISYFTILSNGLVALAGIGTALPDGRLHGWSIRPGTRAAISVYILVVAVIFQLLLAGLVHLSPLGWWGNMLVHQLAPAGWLLSWLAFGPHGGIGRWAPLRWLIFPAVYGGWTILHGALGGWYSYPFMNVGRFGGGIVARNMLVIGLFFALLGFLFAWIDRRLARRVADGVPALKRNRPGTA